MKIVEDILSGNRLSLARLLTLVESFNPSGLAALDELFQYTGKAHLIGITGSPGTGKSSLVNQLALGIRNPQGGKPSRKVAVVAVDPSSPFTGGALLGDRVRMRDLSGDPGVFIRSMASRGALGGLARATSNMTQVLDAAGFDMILIETVGVGQSEIDVASLAHTVIVVEAPGMGDDIQTAKAGILEIADILVVNKADLPGAENTERALRAMLDIANPGHIPLQHHVASQQALERSESHQGWVPPVYKTVSILGQGVEELLDGIEKHHDYLQISGNFDLRNQARLKAELDDLLRDTLVNTWHNQLPDGKYETIVQRLVKREISPYQAVSELIVSNNPVLLNPQKGGIFFPNR